jgi:hypothetical protein
MEVLTSIQLLLSGYPPSCVEPMERILALLVILPAYPAVLLKVYATPAMRTIKPPRVLMGHIACATESLCGTTSTITDGDAKDANIVLVKVTKFAWMTNKPPSPFILEQLTACHSPLKPTDSYATETLCPI